MIQRMWELTKRAILGGLRAMGYDLVHVPAGPVPVNLTGRNVPLAGTSTSLRIAIADRTAEHKPIHTSERFAEIDSMLAQVVPWSGQVPDGYVVDFLGILTDGSFLWNKTGPFGGHYVRTTLPTFSSYGEGWFEVADWFYSARDARGQYVAISLGAAFGAQLVGAWKTLQAINPLPARLVAVEPLPQHYDWIRQHMAVNGIDPDQHWIVQAALGPNNEPILFPIGAPGTGLTASVPTNSTASRQIYAKFYGGRRLSKRVIKNLFLYNSTGIPHELGFGHSAEIKFVSAVTLRDVLTPFDRVDLLEVDIQQAEAEVIAPCMDIVRRKVRRVHIGTHSHEVHDTLRELFSAAGWEIIFDYAPESRHATERGPLDLIDGIFTARNPAV
jgi:FkbM family methyltransferase